MKPDTSAEAVERMARHLAPLLMGTTLQGAPDIFRALAAERDAVLATIESMREGARRVTELLSLAELDRDAARAEAERLRGVIGEAIRCIGDSCEDEADRFLRSALAGGAE